MTTRLFVVMDLMKGAAVTVPELAGITEVEQVLPVTAEQLPVISIVPSRTQPTAIAGEMESREAVVTVLVRTAGAQPGRRAHELLSLLHGAVCDDEGLAYQATLRLGSERFRYVDSEQSICDLQAEYEIAFEHSRTSLD